MRFTNFMVILVFSKSKSKLRVNLSLYFMRTEQLPLSFIFPTRFYLVRVRLVPIEVIVSRSAVKSGYR